MPVLTGEPGVLEGVFLRGDVGCGDDGVRDMTIRGERENDSSGRSTESVLCIAIGAGRFLRECFLGGRGGGGDEARGNLFFSGRVGGSGGVMILR